MGVGWEAVAEHADGTMLTQVKSPAPRVAVLGPVAITAADGQPVNVPGATSRALIASLALAAPAPRSIEALADDLWGDELPQSPRGSLQSLISRLRAVAGADLIRSEAGGYALGVPADAVDLAAAGALDIDASRLAIDDPARLTLLDDALALWRGQAGADLGHAPIAAALTDTASTLRDAIETARAGSLIALGRTKEAVHALTIDTAVRPYDEPRHMQLMTALAADDRPQEALAVFAALRERLREDLGADPGPGASALNTAILQGNRTSGAGRVRIGLRAEPNTLIGREGELHEVASLLARARLVTLLGAGGLGKTRLAQSVAAASESPMVAVVALASIRNDDDLVPAIGAALGISEARASSRLSDARAQPDLRSRLVTLLSERRTLLVLDNCEQIVGGVAEWVTDMLGSVSTLRVLTTSRTPIAVAGELVHPVAPLSIRAEGDAEGPAVQLFLERARAARPTAVLGLAAVRRLCERLDGLPLAIELAAARVRSMTAEQIEERLNDRFALLRSGDRSAPERHRTLEAVIEWSWELLDPATRHALATLSLLPAGFSAMTAAAVLDAAQIDDLLDRLVAQSLLVVSDDSLTSSIRFRMLETVREFGITRLSDGADADAWDAVLTWAGGFFSRPGSSLFAAHAPLRAEMFREVRAENDNLIAALRHAIDTDRATDVVLIAATLTQSWIVQSTFTELVGFAAPILDAITDLPDAAVPADALASVLLCCAVFSLIAGDLRGLRALSQIRKLLRRSPERLSPALRTLVAVVDASPRPERVSTILAEARADPDPAVRLVAQVLTSQLSENEGDAATAYASSRYGWELAEQTEQPWLAAMAASAAAHLSSQAAEPAQAMIWFERARRGFEDFGAVEELRQLDWTRGGSLVALGRLDEATALFEQLTALGDDTQQGMELAATGWFGLAEVERSRGNTLVAIDGYERAVKGFHSVDQRASPWYIIALAGFISAATLDQTLPDDELAHWARRLRTRVLALQRLRPTFGDRPVLGAALTGWSAWAMKFPELQARAVEALAVAETLGARQDLPSLHLTVHLAHAVEIVGADVIAGARAAASALSLVERAERAMVVLGALPREIPRGRR